MPASAWTPAVEPDGGIRDGAQGAEIDAGSDCLAGWPKGMRPIVRKERPHPGAQGQGRTVSTTSTAPAWEATDRLPPSRRTCGRLFAWGVLLPSQPTGPSANDRGRSRCPC
ncbi:hypothetical protein GCM10018772_23790 [Streptomyces fumanus]|uniref:Uncharacterized protein n=1 Tax=Streptomyces fumanus TaxID=67302 RepID=A0A919E0U4_9ACTN|nr:hypothetical protein GCM10018772_23790 [Streptomyces fumanus]